MAKFIWNNGNVPENLKITQVYGLVFTKDGRMLLKVERKKDKAIYSLAGGHPEEYDKDMSDTLKREFIEEVNTTLIDPIMVGYQLVDEENGIPPYAQVRMTAIIDEIKESKPDPDNGKTYQRLLTTPDEAIRLLNWGECGRLQVLEALRIAKEELNIITFSNVIEYV